MYTVVHRCTYLQMRALEHRRSRSPRRLAGVCCEPRSQMLDSDYLSQSWNTISHWCFPHSWNKVQQLNKLGNTTNSKQTVAHMAESVHQ